MKATTRQERKRGWRIARRTFCLTACEQCGKSGRDRHHKDGNSLNNDPSNVMRLCRKCHMAIDGRLIAFMEMAKASKPNMSSQRWGQRQNTSYAVGDKCPACGKAITIVSTRTRLGFYFTYLGCRKSRGGCGFNAGSIKVPNGD